MVSLEMPPPPPGGGAAHPMKGPHIVIAICCGSSPVHLYSMAYCSSPTVISGMIVPAHGAVLPACWELMCGRVDAEGAPEPGRNRRC